MKTVYLNASYFPAVELLSAIGTAAILLFGGYQVIEGQIVLGVLVAFVGYLQTFFDPIQQISQLYTTYQQGMAALDKIFDLLDTEPDVVDGPNPIDPGEIKGGIDLEGVWFGYAEEPGPGDGLGADRHRPADPARPDRRPRRRDRRREVDPGEADRALLRPAARADPDRRDRRPRARLERVAQPPRHRSPGGFPVQRHDRRQRRVRPPRSPARRTSSRPCTRSAVSR